LKHLACEMAHVLKKILSKADWDSLSENQISTFKAAESIWRENGKGTHTIECYRIAVMYFLLYCSARGLDPHEQLTHDGVLKFSREFARVRGRAFLRVWHRSHSALRNWSQALQSLGVSLPQWRPEEDRKSREQPDVLQKFRNDLESSGLAPKTIHEYMKAGEHLVTHLSSSDRELRRLQIRDIDELIANRRRQISLSSVKKICDGLRRFLRFLYATNRHKRDLSVHLEHLFAPESKRPPRALPWDSVRRILRAVDRSIPIERRDYAMLLMMSMYGCAAGEVIGLRLEDIDWHGNRLHLKRAKTRVPIELPLLPEIARALADYLQHGRPRHASTRAVFVCTRCPHQALSSATRISARIKRYATRAGVEAEFLGSHALRHSHASRQLELGTSPKVIGDILGHVDPQSTGVYLRSALSKLRQLALPVPQ
jgi:integrase/recombinase XerD